MTINRPAITEPEFHLDATTFFTHRRRTRAEREESGRSVRDAVPLAAHATRPPTADRPDPVQILQAQESDREPELVPLRYARMGVDPFAFLRGAAAVMAADLSRLPTSGITVQLCGDAHLANFGMFASAERTLVFDLNDFDETLPGPFEWDVKRLAASAAVAARAAGATDKRARRCARASVAAYRTTMSRLSRMRTLDVWNARLDVDTLLDRVGKTALRKAAVTASKKSRASTGDAALVKLTETVHGRRRFRSEPPILMRVPEADMGAVVARLAPVYEGYLRTVAPDRIALLARFSFVDVAHKVVGVGSVGTRALVLLLESGDGEPLLLQVKQANASALERHLGASSFVNAGKRVVVGQRVLQSGGDPFLGWMEPGDQVEHDFYVRQLKDMKGSIDPARLEVDALSDYARVCGAVLARAHARAGDAATITGYLGDTDEFDTAVADFALAYSDLTGRDHATLRQRAT